MASSPNSPGRRAERPGLTAIVRQAQAFTRASGAAIALVTNRSGEIECCVRSGRTAPPLGKSQLQEGLTALCLRSGRRLLCCDTQSDERVSSMAMAELGVRSLVLTPIKQGPYVLGVLTMFADTPDAFNAAHLAELDAAAAEIAQALGRDGKGVPALPLQPVVATEGVAVEEPVEAVGRKPPASAYWPPPVRDLPTRSAHPEVDAPAEQEPTPAATFSFATLDAAAMPRRSLSGKLIAATAALLLVAGGGAWTYLAMSKRTAAPASIGPDRDGATAAIAKATLKIDPEAITSQPKKTFAINLILSGAPDLASAAMQIDYDPKLIQFVSAADGGLLAKGDEPALLAHRDDPIAGVLKISAQRPPGSLSASGDGTVLRLMFVARGKGSGQIAIAPSARDSQGRPIDVLAAHAQVNITNVK